MAVKVALWAMVASVSSSTVSAMALLGQLADGNAAGEIGTYINGGALAASVGGLVYVLRAMLSGRLVALPTAQLIEGLAADRDNTRALLVAEQERADRVHGLADRLLVAIHKGHTSSVAEM